MDSFRKKLRGSDNDISRNIADILGGGQKSFGGIPPILVKIPNHRHTTASQQISFKLTTSQCQVGLSIR